MEQLIYVSLYETKNTGAQTYHKKPFISVNAAHEYVHMLTFTVLVHRDDFHIIVRRIRLEN